MRDCITIQKVLNIHPIVITELIKVIFTVLTFIIVDVSTDLFKINMLEIERILFTSIYTTFESCSERELDSGGSRYVLSWGCYE